MKSDRQRVREAIRQAEPGRIADGLVDTNGNGAAALLPREQRAAQGSPEFTQWCPTCKERCVPMRDGRCGFCQTQLEEPDPPPTSPRSPDSPPSQVEPAGSELRLGEDLVLPLDAATQSLAILAVKGAGKSNAAAVLVEELFDLGISWLVVDPKGDWWGIREAVGDARGLPVVVLGGEHGDLPLQPGSGRAVADLVVDRDLSCVLDISAMDDEQRPEFLHAFGDRLFELHRLRPTVRHLIVEEAQEVVPQGAGKEMRPTLRVWTRIVCQGRQRGLGITLVSQRSALVSKNVLTQTGSLLVLRTTSPQDRAVIKGWTDFHSVSRELVDSLPGLANGEAWIVAPSWLGRVDRVRLRRRWTFDSGATPPVVSARRPQLAVDVDEIRRALAPEPNESHAPDPEQVILQLLEEGPRHRSELAAALGDAAELDRALAALRGREVVYPRGRGRGATWCLCDADEPDPEAGDVDEIHNPDLGENPNSAGSPPDVGMTLARRVVRARRDADEALRDLDAILEDPRDGLTLLRARYLAALLKRIEDGDSDPQLLDRFERAAGLAGTAT